MRHEDKRIYEIIEKNGPITEPEQSFEIMAAHLMRMLPNIDRKQIEKLLK